MLPDLFIQRMRYGLGGTPEVVRAILASLPDASWYDRRPDPERFTIREILAHLADYDDIFSLRLNEALTEDNPNIAPRNPGQLAVDHNYANADPQRSLERLTASRAKICDLVNGLTPAQWDRYGTNETMGKLTVETQVTFIVIHDSYHTRQLAEWVK